MKIIATVRTRNEEENIERFCQSYQWADKILVADGGSRDRTKELALKYPNVEVRDFISEIGMENGHTRNPHGEHLNFLIDWAFVEEKADWIVQDDCDCFPNKFLQDNARAVLEDSSNNFVYVTRLYLWEDIGYFPKVSQDADGNWTPGLWAWNQKAGLRFKTDTTPQEHQVLSFVPRKRNVLNLMPPYALLHCPWRNKEVVERKLKYYRESGEVPNMVHPLITNGAVEPLPEWAAL